MEHSYPIYQTYTPTVILKHEPKSRRPYRRQVGHPPPQTLQGEFVVKPETLLLIIFGLLYDSDINEGYRKLLLRCSKRMISDRNIKRR